MYAQFDSTAPAPQPVIGWHYGMTPAAAAVLPADLLELTQAAWDNRLNTPFVSGGALVAAPAPTAAQIAAEAIAVANAAIKQQIKDIENGQPRAVREAAIGAAGAVARLQTLDAQIATLRGQLK